MAAAPTPVGYPNHLTLSNQSYYLPAAVDTLTGRKYLEGKVSPIVNPAISKDPRELAMLREQIFQSPNAEHVKIPIKDGALLDGVLFKTENSRGVIYYCLGREGCYEYVAKRDDLVAWMIDFFTSYVGDDIDILLVNPSLE